MAQKSLSGSKSKTAPQQKRGSDKKRSGEHTAGSSAPSSAAKSRAKAAASDTESGA